MTCILRAAGINFEVDHFVARSPLVTDSLWRKGEKRGAKINDTSGLRIVVSEADFSDLSQQIEDAIAFFRKNQEYIKALVSFPGAEWIVLDFGTEIYPPGYASFTFPPELLTLAGATGVSLCLSVYPTDPETEFDT